MLRSAGTVVSVSCWCWPRGQRVVLVQCWPRGQRVMLVLCAVVAGDGAEQNPGVAGRRAAPHSTQE